MENGAVRPRAGGQPMRYGALIGGKSFELKVDAAASLKDPAWYRIVGQPVARVDIPAKVTGQFTFMQDFRLSGMLHGRVVRPPAIGASLLSVDESSVRSIAGRVQVVRRGNFLGVVAENEWAAIRGAQQLKASWSSGSALPDESKLWEHVRATKIVKDDITSDVGAAEGALRQASRRLAAT